MTDQTTTNQNNKLSEFYGFLLEIVDNDTLIITGLISIAFTYIFINATDAAQVISNIISILGGALGVSRLSKKNVN